MVFVYYVLFVNVTILYIWIYKSVDIYGSWYVNAIIENKFKMSGRINYSIPTKKKKEYSL